MRTRIEIINSYYTTQIKQKKKKFFAISLPPSSLIIRHPPQKSTILQYEKKHEKWKNSQKGFYVYIQKQHSIQQPKLQFQICNVRKFRLQSTGSMMFGITLQQALLHLHASLSALNSTKLQQGEGWDAIYIYIYKRWIIIFF